MTSVALQTNFRMMKGTSGKADYVVFAHKGDIALGIKVEAVISGTKFKMPGTVWFGTRLRSAKLAGLTTAGEGGFTSLSNIVQLKKTVPLDVAGAWPDVVWENNDAHRASTSVGIFVPGRPDGAPEEIARFAENIANGKLSTDMAAYLMKLAGECEFILTLEELAEYLENIFKPVFKLMNETVKKQLWLKAEMVASVGMFGMQAALIKKVYGEHAKAQGGPLDDDGEAAAEDGGDVETGEEE